MTCRAYLLLVYSFLHLLASFHGALSSTQAENQTALLEHIFSNYTPYVRPVCDVDAPVQVKIDIAIRQIIELDEPKQILYLNAWIRLHWDDCHMLWDPSNFGSISNIVVPFNRVWSPDITLYDNGDSELEGSKDYLINIQNSGNLIYYYPTIIKVLCRIDVVYFPFDTQVCPLKFGSWSYHGFEINVTNRDPDGDMTSYVENTEWDLLRLPVTRHELKYGCCPEPYPDVTFYVTMKRKPLFYVLNLLFPCLLITAVALLGFLLPPDAGEKVSLEITVLLSLAVFLLVVSETLPATSEGFPYIGVYFAMAMLLVSLSTLLTVLVLNVHHKGNLNKPVPLWVRRLVLNFLGKLVRVQNEMAVHPFESKSKRAGLDARSLQRETYINGYKHPIWAYEDDIYEIDKEFQNKEQAHCNGNGTSGGPRSHNGGNPFNRHNHHKKNNLEGQHVGERPLGNEFFPMRPSAPNNTSLQNTNSDTARDGAETGLDASFNLPAGNGFSTTEQSNLSLALLREQLHVLEREEARIEGKVKHDQLSTEWKRVACVLDRVFLLLFLFILVASSLGILLPLSTS